MKKRLAAALKVAARTPAQAHAGRWIARNPAPLPLFDAPAVTHDDICEWLRAVARMAPDSPRAAAYVRAYDVAGKISAAKAAGQWPPKEKGPDFRASFVSTAYRSTAS
ncbi:MAG: hypothetical protein EG825_10250 [Rhodocyclaceae bacterium]|nr:hypothetical protein [Rhodocyclaceae bacterium]